MLWGRLPSVVPQETEAIELDDLLDSKSADGSSGIETGEQESDMKNLKLRNRKEEQAYDDSKMETSPGPPVTVAIEDKLALELDALLYDSDRDDDGNKVDIPVIEEKPLNLMASKIKKNSLTCNSTYHKEVVSKDSSGETNKKIERRNRVNFPKRTLTQKPREEKSQFSTSFSDTLSHSKKKIMTTRDRMREYSRILSSRTSNQLRNDIKLNTRERKKKYDPNPAFVSTTTKRLFESSAPLSKRIFGEGAHEEGEEPKTKSPCEQNVNKKGFSHYMKSTVTFTNKVVETQIIEQRKTKLKESNAKKILVNLTPWKTKQNPPVSRPNFDDADLKETNYASPSPRLKDWKQISTFTSETISSISKVANTVLIQTQKARERESGKIESPRFQSPREYVTRKANSTNQGALGRFAGAYRESPARSYAERSIGSLSSQCTVESFVSPTKEGIVGCQESFDPFLYKNRGACELCIFRLSEREKEKLDAHGRHYLVQFTTGGCPNCSAFPKSSRDQQVRLCRMCYSVSHRRMQTRRRKKGNGSSMGYSFAKVSTGKVF